MSDVSSFRSRVSGFVGAGGPKLLKDLMSLATGQAAVMVLGFVTFAYLARTLTINQYGSLEFAISVASFAAIVIECGAGTIGVRELARDPDHQGEILTAVSVARMAMAAVVVPVILIGVYMSAFPREVSVLVVLYALSLFAVPLKQEWLLQSKERMKWAAVAQPVRALIFALGAFILVRSSGDFLRLGLIEIAAVSVVSLYYLMAQRISGARFAAVVDLRRAAFYLRHGFAIGASNMIWAFMLYAPIFLLFVLNDGKGTPYLGAAQRIVISLVTMSFIYHFNLYPVITRTLVNDRGAWQRVMRSSLHVVAWGSVAVALVITLMSREIMTWVFGDGFAPGGGILAILIWIFPLRMLSGHARWSLVGAAQQSWLLLAEVAGALVLLGVALALIPAFGAAGSALALVAGILTSGVLTQIKVESSIGDMKIFVNGMPAFLAAALSAGIALGTVDQVFWRLAVGVGVYCGLMLLQARRLLADLHKVAYAKAT